MDNAQVAEKIREIAELLWNALPEGADVGDCLQALDVVKTSLAAQRATPALMVLPWQGDPAFSPCAHHAYIQQLGQAMADAEQRMVGL